MASTRQTSTSTSRSPHTVHRNRTLCAGHKAQILDVLQSAYPYAPSLDDLRSITSRLSARIEELRSDGWSIETIPLDGRLSTYRLLSRVKGAPLVYSAAVTLHLPVGGQATYRTHERLSGDFTQDLLDYAGEQARKAYMRALRVKVITPSVESVSDDSDFEGGVW